MYASISIAWPYRGANSVRSLCSMFFAVRFRELQRRPTAHLRSAVVVFQQDGAPIVDFVNLPALALLQPRVSGKHYFAVFGPSCPDVMVEGAG
jgi:hypothetical protein